jgi:lipopolysaccharide/colanic/teichoic acid biosynthesis glycosyltransferase
MPEIRIINEQTICKTQFRHAPWAIGLKRLFDVGISLSILAFAWPLLILIALAVKCSSPGPVFYRGIRTGLHLKPFRILKFRTMVPEAEALGGPTTGTDDPRVTPIGRILRRSKLDELPQFLNVLWGDMSLVGPRPEVPEYTRLYQNEEQLILAMRPGVTDYASIEFADLDDRVGSSDPDAFFRQHILPKKNQLRVKYVKNWSLREDLRILMLTCRRVIQRIAGK